MTTATTPPTSGALAGPSDEDLAPRLAARDEAAVALLLERWWARAYRLALQLVGDATVAEDVAQEAFVQVLRAAPGFDPTRGAFAPWLLRIVRNAAFNASRARARRAGHEAAAARPEAGGDDPAAEAAARVDGAVVRAQLAALSPQYREAVALHCLQGLTFQEVAEVLGCPLGTVASRVRRGLDGLRARLASAAPAALPAVGDVGEAGDAAVVDAVLRAFAGAPVPAAPTVQVTLAAAAAAAPAASWALTRASRPRWTWRLKALLAMAGVLVAGTATFSLLLDDPTTTPARRGVALAPRVARTGADVDLTAGREGGPGGEETTSRGERPSRPQAPAAPEAADEAAPQAVDAVAYDALGGRVAAGRRDGTVEVWDLRERVRVHRLAGHGARVTAVAFAGDGALLVSASYDGTARVWETVRGSCVHVLAHSTASDRRVLALGVSPDGALAATAGEDGRVRLWALAQGELLRTLDAHTRAARAASFDRTGATLLTAGEDHRLVLWSAQGEPLAEVASDAGFSHALLDRDGSAITAGAPLQVERFDLTTRARTGWCAGEGPLALSPPRTPEADRGLLLRAGAGVLRLIDPVSAAERLRLVDDDDVLLACALSPDGGHALTGGESGRIKVWDLRAGPAEPVSVSLVGEGEDAASRDAIDRVAVAAAPGAGAPAVTRVLPTPPGVDADLVRRRLRQATIAERRAMIAELDARDAASLTLLLEALAGAWSDWTVRQAAVEAVARLLGDERVQAGVAAALARDDTPDGAREGLALAMGLTRSQAFLGRLLRLLEDDEAAVVRRAVAIALVGLRDARSVEPLIRALEREQEPRAAALQQEALERLTGADVAADGWRRWWEERRYRFEVSRHDAPAGRHEVIAVDRRAAGHEVRWSVLVRGRGRPVLVLPELGYRPSYLAACLRWLERDHTVAYVDPREVDDVTAMAGRLDRVRQALVASGALPDGPELVVAHGLSSLVATRYAHLRPKAAGLLLVSPFSSAQAWVEAVRRVERNDRGAPLGRVARLLLAPPGRLPVGAHEADERAALRRDLFTSFFRDPDDLLIGHLLGRRRESAEYGFVHAAEQVHEPTPPPGAAAEGWHEVRTAVVFGRRTPWDSPDDAARMAPYEDHRAFEGALRWLSE